jgi:hypothetical protein
MDDYEPLLVETTVIKSSETESIRTIQQLYVVMLNYNMIQISNTGGPMSTICDNSLACVMGSIIQRDGQQKGTNIAEDCQAMYHTLECMRTSLMIV